MRSAVSMFLFYLYKRHSLLRLHIYLILYCRVHLSFTVLDLLRDGWCNSIPKLRRPRIRDNLSTDTRNTKELAVDLGDCGVELGGGQGIPCLTVSLSHCLIGPIKRPPPPFFFLLSPFTLHTTHTPSPRCPQRAR